MNIGLIGCGNMGSALIASCAKSSLSCSFFLSDADKTKSAALAATLGGTVSDNKAICDVCDFVFLAVKPQILPAVLDEIAPAVKARIASLTLISMAAGVATDKILSHLSPDTSLIRIMPNTPAMVGEGVIVYDTRSVSDDTEKAFRSLLQKAGLVEKLPEEKIDAACALHGSGPAYAFLFLEALADGGVLCGLSRDAALRFAAQTLKGSAEMVLQTGRHPGELKDAVTSPGGTTIEAVRVLEDGAFRGTVVEAVRAAYRRALEMGK